MLKRTMFVAWLTLIALCLQAQNSGLVSEGVICLDRGQSRTIPLKLQPSSTYHISAMLKTESGTDIVRLQVSGLGQNNISLASAKANWTTVEANFNVGENQTEAYIEVAFDDGQTGRHAYAEKITLTRTGNYKEQKPKGFSPREQRETVTDLGLAMQPDSKIEWMKRDKLGMFVHWGLYAGPARGEWYMENNGVPIAEYRKYAFPVSGDEYFDAKDFDAGKWAALAKKAGFRYITLTTQHHDGFALFDSKHPNAFTSVQTLGRDFVKEFVEATRNAGLKVGFYKTLINWRYPGYYDIYGTGCWKNKFGYVTAPWHKDNARSMKEELYCQTYELMTNYGKIDQLFWDGGWLGQQGSDADAAPFWESGKWMSADNQWPVDSAYIMNDPETGKPLGLMGMVRALQPDIVVNPRSGWIGDYTCEEGGGDVKGPIRNGVVEKCMTICQAWGYTKTAEDPARIAPLTKIKRICADCMTRGMCFLVNVAPDRHGNIPDAIVNRLEEFGQWVYTNADAIYETAPGPWNPVDGQYGFTYKDNKLFVYFLGGYNDTTFTLPPMDKGYKAKKAYRLDTQKNAEISQRGRHVTISGISTDNNDITIYVIELNRKINANKK